MSLDSTIVTTENLHKIITVCGSMRFWSEITHVAYDLRELGYQVLTPIYTRSVAWDEKDTPLIDKLREDFLRKIEVCNILYVVNRDGYIGNHTQEEIEYAKKLGKQIEYMEIPSVDKPEIITICGSGRFKDDIMKLAEFLNNGKRIVFTPEIFKLEGNRINYLTEEEHLSYDILHFYKMQMSDYILIYDKDEYIGEDTMKEIEYAKLRGMDVRYYSKSEELSNQMDVLNAINAKLGI